MKKTFSITIINGKPTCAELAGYELPELKFSHQDLIDLVQAIKDYTYESGGVLGYDEREASEFVDIFLNGRNRTPIAIEVEMRYYYKDCIQFDDTDTIWIECYKSRFDELKKLTMIETKEVPKLNPDGTVKGTYIFNE